MWKGAGGGCSRAFSSSAEPAPDEDDSTSDTPLSAGEGGSDPEDNITS